MIDTERSSSHSRAIAALFDTRAAADAAAADLMEAGIAPSRISVAGEEHFEEDVGRDDGVKGFWEALKSFFMPEDDRRLYAEGLRRGGYLVSVQPLDHEYERALDILDREGAVDIEEREAFWRSEGWAGRSLDESAPTPSAGAASVAAAATGSSAPATASARDEGLAAARRDAELSRARVRSYGPEATARPDAPDAALDEIGASRPMAAQASQTVARQIVAHMDVVGSDGVRIGAVDHLEGGDSIELEQDDSPDGARHHVPLAWVDHVDLKVHLNRGGAEARSAW